MTEYQAVHICEYVNSLCSEPGLHGGRDGEWPIRQHSTQCQSHCISGDQLRAALEILGLWFDGEILGLEIGQRLHSSPLMTGHSSAWYARATVARQGGEPDDPYETRVVYVPVHPGHPDHLESLDETLGEPRGRSVNCKCVIPARESSLGGDELDVIGYSRLGSDKTTTEGVNEDEVSAIGGGCYPGHQCAGPNAHHGIGWANRPV